MGSITYVYKSGWTSVLGQMLDVQTESADGHDRYAVSFKRSCVAGMPCCQNQIVTLCIHIDVCLCTSSGSAHFFAHLQHMLHVKNLKRVSWLNYDIYFGGYGRSLYLRTGNHEISYSPFFSCSSLWKRSDLSCILPGIRFCHFCNACTKRCIYMNNHKHIHMFSAYNSLKRLV